MSDISRLPEDTVNHHRRVGIQDHRSRRAVAPRVTWAVLKWLTLTSDKTGVIDVSWSTPSRIYSFGPSGFNINWAKADEAYPISGDTLGWATADGDARSHTLPGLETGVAYKVRVQSVNPRVLRGHRDLDHSLDGGDRHRRVDHNGQDCRG